MKFVKTLKEICASIKDDTNDTVSLPELADVATSAVHELETENADLNKWVNNALEALDAVKASGEVSADDVREMIELGLSGKPQRLTTRLG